MHFDVKAICHLFGKVLSGEAPELGAGRTFGPANLIGFECCSLCATSLPYMSLGKSSSTLYICYIGPLGTIQMKSNAAALLAHCGLRPYSSSSPTIFKGSATPLSLSHTRPRQDHDYA